MTYKGPKVIKRMTINEAVEGLVSHFKKAHEHDDYYGNELADVYESITGEKCYYDAKEEKIVIEYGNE